MREIKLQAWYEHDGAMTTVDQIRFDYGDAWIKYPYGYRKLVDLRELKLREYTGLKDKNGKEIYEGDITDVQDNGYPFVKNWKGIVKFIDGSYLVENLEGTDGEYLFDETREIEVIGNIHEHPHLLKGDEANAQTT